MTRPSHDKDETDGQMEPGCFPVRYSFQNCLLLLPGDEHTGTHTHTYDTTRYF